LANWDKASSISVLFIDINLCGAGQVMFQDNPLILLSHVFRRFVAPLDLLFC